MMPPHPYFPPMVNQFGQPLKMPIGNPYPYHPNQPYLGQLPPTFPYGPQIHPEMARNYPQQPIRGIPQPIVPTYQHPQSLAPPMNPHQSEPMNIERGAR